jgi:prolyl-tRNA synthetase
MLAEQSKQEHKLLEKRKNVKSQIQDHHRDVKKYDIFPKNQDHGKWYQSVLTVSDMIDYSSVGGCYVLKPLSMQIWNAIKVDLNTSIIKLGVDDCYFPLFVTKTNLEREASHFSDFTPEVAWIVTDDSAAQHIVASDKSLDESIKTLQSSGLEVYVRTKTSERYAVRPTSETIIYPHFAEWIKKSGTYPKINQWANVVRWENKATQPFIRSREFLWQEGHTCHPNKEDALIEVYKVLEIYKDFYEKLLAVPTIDGHKTKSETFPGADLTTTVEGFLPDSGRGIQAATSHYLGQKFSTIFNIKDSNGQLVHQNSWGLTTRSIGIMVMTHSDDRGLVLPPALAPVQVVLIACGITSKISELEKEHIYNTLYKLCDILNRNGIKTVFDSDNNETPGMKFNKWEVKGVPLRLEYGPKDVLNDTILFVRRDQPPKTKEIIKFSIVDSQFMNEYLSNIQSEMFNKASIRLKENIIYCKTNNDVVNALKNKNLALINWKDSDDDGIMEENLKQICRENNINSTKILCIPHSNTLINLGFNIDKKNTFALFGRSY